jgi:pSer/pThr/pTyr-binding forkhead associated (FHA) protein
MPRVTITVPENSPQPYRFDLKREVVSIGRNHENDIVIASGSVSGKHAEMRRVEGGYQLIDVGSTNGIKIDGIRHQVAVLQTGMVVKLGDVEFGFTLNEEELAELASESERLILPAADEYQVDEQEDDLDKLPELPAAKEEKSQNRKNHKDEDFEDSEEDIKLEKREKAARREEAKQAAKREEAEKREQLKKARRRERAERAEKNSDRDEFSESKAVTIGSGFILFALIAVAGAFFYGASTRHEKDTGEGLLKAMVNKEDIEKETPAEPQDKAGADADSR